MHTCTHTHLYIHARPRRAAQVAGQIEPSNHVLYPNKFFTVVNRTPHPAFLLVYPTANKFRTRPSTYSSAPAATASPSPSAPFRCRITRDHTVAPGRRDWAQGTA